MSEEVQQPSVIQVTEKDLPLHCPTPSMSLWNQHPRVFLDVAAAGHAACPYCGTRYEWSGSVVRSGH